MKNARAEVKKEAHYITPHAGGDGALRDAVEFILKAQGKWKEDCRSLHRRTQPHSSDKASRALAASRLLGLSSKLRSSEAEKKKPTGCLLGACSGQHPMGYRFSLLTLLFSGVCEDIKHPSALSSV